MVLGSERDLVRRARRAAAEHDRRDARPSAVVVPNVGVGDAVDAHRAVPHRVKHALDVAIAA